MTGDPAAPPYTLAVARGRRSITIVDCYEQAWAPGGRRLAVAAREGRGSRVFVVEPSAGALFRSRLFDEHVRLRWDGDGTLVVLCRAADRLGPIHVGDVLCVPRPPDA